MRLWDCFRFYMVEAATPSGLERKKHARNPLSNGEIYLQGNPRVKKR